jgi:hypothetical protein
VKYRLTQIHGDQYEAELADPVCEIVRRAIDDGDISRIELRTVSLVGRDGIAIEWMTVWQGGG